VGKGSEPKQFRYSKTIICDAGRYFRNKKKEYMKAKIDELETDSETKKVRDLYKDFSD